jgi:hypothetical protein
MYLMSKNMLKKATPLVLSVLTACAPAGKDGATGADGAQGAVGVDGADAKVCAITPIVGGPAGATITCDDGTTANVSGGDTGTDGTGCTAVSNGDGTLTVTCGASAPVVITPTPEVAGCDVFIGSVDYSVVASRPLVDGCRAITGDLRVAGLEAGADVSGLASIRAIGGDLNVEQVPGVDLPLLTTVGGELNVFLIGDRLSLPALTRIGRALSASDIRDGATMDFPALESIGGFLILSGVRDQNLVFPALRSVRDLQIDQSSATVSFPALTEVISQFLLRDNVGMTSFSAPLVATLNAPFVVQNNSQLTSFDMSGLRSVGANFRVDFNNNPVLPGCFVPTRAFNISNPQNLTGNLPADEASCDNCPGLANEDQADLDFDNVGDACDTDVDGDTLLDAADPSPRIGFVCGDSDADGCDDCSRAGRPDVANDGVDTDGNGACDGVLDAAAGDRCAFKDAAKTLMVCGRQVEQPTAVELCIAHGGRLYEPRTQQAIDDASTLLERNASAWVGMTHDEADDSLSYLTAPTAVAPLTIDFSGFVNGIGCMSVNSGGYRLSGCTGTNESLRGFACEQN